MLKYSLNNKRGQALTEFVIIIPVLFLLIFGIMQMCLIYSSYIVVSHAAYTAARAGVVHYIDGTYKSKAKEAARIICKPLIGDSIPEVIVEESDGVVYDAEYKQYVTAPNDLKITVTYHMPIIFPLLGKALGGKAIPVSATCKMMMEKE